MFCFVVFIKAFWRLMILFHILVGRICEIIILCGIDKKDRYIRQAHFIHTYFSLSTQWEYFFSIKRKTLEKCTFWDRLIHHHHCWDLPLCDKNQKMFVSLSDASTKTSTSTEFVFCIYQHILFSYVSAERTVHHANSKIFVKNAAQCSIYVMIDYPKVAQKKLNLN